MVYSNVRCPVQSCAFNLQERGVTCGWLTGKSKRCHHPVYREAWQAAHELEAALAVEAEAAPVIPGTLSVYDHNAVAPARSLAGRAAASKPMAPERARQLALAFESEV